MDHKPLFQAAGLAAVVAVISVLVMGFGVQSPQAGLSFQPSMPPTPGAEFIRPTNEFPDLTLRFFAADSLFILSYTVVFAGLYAVASGRSRVLAAVGLGAGLLAALCDAAENAFFITYALQSLAGVPLKEPDLPLIYIIANLKWMGAFAAFYAFGLAWPREGWFGWLLAGLMVLFTLVGVLGVALPGLIALRGLFFLVGMPLFAGYFWWRARRES